MMKFDRTTLLAVKAYAETEESWARGNPDQSNMFIVGYADAMTSVVDFVDRELKHLEESE